MTSRKIQVTVDEQLDKRIRARAKQMGLSVSSYARLALMNAVPQKKRSLLDNAIGELQSNDVESMTLAEFNRQLDKL